MKLDCKGILPIIQTFSLVKSCDLLRDGSLRIATPFTHQNGSNIDLFLRPRNDLFDGFVLTDLGFTTAYLLDLSIKPTGTKKRKIIVDDICSSLGVIFADAQLQIDLPKENLAILPDLMVRLSQACIRISDLAFNQKFRIENSFKEDVEEFLVDVGVEFESNAKFAGQYNNIVEVDFKVAGKRNTTLIKTLSTGNSAAAHSLSNEVFRCWYDLAPTLKSTNTFLTIFDTTNDVFREDDLKRIGNFATVLGFPSDSEPIKSLLTA